MIKEYVIGYEDIAFHENNHRLKEIFSISNGSMMVAVVRKLTTIYLKCIPGYVCEHAESYLTKYINKMLI